MNPVIRINSQINHINTMIEIYEKAKTEHNLTYVQTALTELNSQLEFLNLLLQDLEE